MHRLGKLKDTKGVIIIDQSKKNRQHNGQKKKYKQRSTKHTYQTKDRVTRTPLKMGGAVNCGSKIAERGATNTRKCLFIYRLQSSFRKTRLSILYFWRNIMFLRF